MGIGFTGSQGQYERIRRHQSLQQVGNQVERESPERLDGVERKQTRWCRFGVWLRDWSRAVWSGTKIIVQWAVGLFVVGFIVALVVNGYQSLDNSGWITHDHDTPVWIQGDWLVGEYRKCDMPVRTTRLFCGGDAIGGGSIVGFTGSVSDDDAANALNAAMTRNAQTDWTPLEKYFHVLPVRYYGRLIRPERDTERAILSWRCQRNSDSLTCKALD